MTRGSAADLRALVLAPRGRDAAVVEHVLHAHQIECETCASVGELVGGLRDGAGLAFVAEEALAGDERSGLLGWLGHQPPWSDFPVVVLTNRHAGRRSAQALATLERLGNVVLLERPLNAETLVSAARSALRSRTRQYQTRQHLDEQQRIGLENDRLYQAERVALREAAEMRELLLNAERIAREEAEHASRSKDEFLATLSHELRTPLSVILGWVHLLRKRNFGGPDLVRGIDTIERNARAQSHLIDELLDMSRIIAGGVHLELQPLMPAAVVDAALASLQPVIDGKSIRLERAIDAAAGPIAADVHRLQQVVSNLLSNAVKFTPIGGRIRVGVSAGDGQVTLAIEDSGEGIAEDFLPFVFDRFRQADGSSTRKHGGLGLGLAIVRHLVALHGGTVLATSGGAGQGAAFSVRLPVCAATAAEPGPALVPGRITPREHASIDPSALLKGLHIVLVDDDADGRDMVARMLSDSGAAVQSTGSASEALAALGSGVMADLLISDIGMPLTDGYALLQQVRRLGHRLPAIALTAFARPEERRKALQTGYAMHLTKPVEPQQLMWSVARLSGRLPEDQPTPPPMKYRSPA